MRTESRELKDLISVGPAMLRDFQLLGIQSVAHLAKQDPRALYAKLGRVAGPASGHLRVGHFSFRRRSSAQSSSACGPMPVVVVEQKAQKGRGLAITPGS